jgi:hypothetical protein
MEIPVHRIYQISFVFGGVPKVRDLEQAFADHDDDWARVAPTLWLLWSPKNTNEIYYRLRPLLDAADLFLVSEIAHRSISGSMPPWVWNWINSKVPGSVAAYESLPGSNMPLIVGPNP